MKRIIALLSAIAMVAAFAACAKKQPEPAATDSDAVETTETAVEATKAADETTEEAMVVETPEATEAAKEYELVTYGRISATVAPEGWIISDESADWRIVYIMPDADGTAYSFNQPTVQLTTDEDSADYLAKRAAEIKDDSGEAYTKEEVTIAGVTFTAIVPELGFAALYGEKDGQTLVLTYSNNVDLQSAAVADIVASVQIAPAE